MKNHSSSRFIAAVALALTVVVASCGNSNKVGDKVDTEGLGGKGGLSLGSTTTTVAAATTLAPSGTTAKAQATTAPAKTTPTTKSTATTTAPKAAFAISIQGDGSSLPFDPRVAPVSSGMVVRWTNKDTVARVVEADDGSFKSPSIPPGGTFEIKAPARSVGYHDFTRPYAVGTIEVS